MKKILSIFGGLLLLFSCSKHDAPVSPDVKVKGKEPVQVLVPLSDDQVNLRLAMSVQETNSSGLRGDRVPKQVADYLAYPSKEDPMLYVFNYVGGGYQIVSARRESYPVLGYSSTGKFPLGLEKEVYRYLLDELVDEVKHCMLAPDSVKSANALAWETFVQDREYEAPLRSSVALDQVIDEVLSDYQARGYQIYGYGSAVSAGLVHQYVQGDIDRYLSAHQYPNQTAPIIYVLVKTRYEHDVKGPLLTSTWDQSPGYNKYVPAVNLDVHRVDYPIGCVPVAVGQLLYYHKLPKHIPWQDMRDAYPTDATAKFLYNLAVKLETVFDVTGGETSKYNVPRVLRSMIGNVVGELEDYSFDKVYREINSSRPVYSRGRELNEKNGHAFIYDGYDIANQIQDLEIIAFDDSSVIDLSQYTTLYSSRDKVSLEDKKLHINLGWGGSGNLFYHHNANARFSENREIIRVLLSK